MNQNYFIGVDISKGKIDVAVLNCKNELLHEKVIVNKAVRIMGLLKGLARKLKTEHAQLLVCCEATGIYTEPLKRACDELQIPLWVEQAYKIKRATTNLRGKSDEQDARRIAEYASRYADKQFLYRPAPAAQSQLKTLLDARESLQLQYNRFKQQLSETKDFAPEKHALLKACYKRPMSALHKQIKKVEQQIEALVKSQQKLANNATLLKSIPGIGQQNALNMILHTQNFTTFSSAAHLACYAGVVPFPNQSGKVDKGKRLSRFANKSLKKLLHLAAMAAIKVKGELREYYIRKVKEGKNKMAVLNAVRNKLVKRMFAVIERQSPYVPEPEQICSIN
jgi:transposase